MLTFLPVASRALPLPLFRARVFPPPRHLASRSSPRPRAKLQVEVVTLCKRSGKDSVFDPSISELAKRMSPVLSVSSRWVKPEHAARTVADLAHRAPVFVLDENGRLPNDSRHFADMLYDALQDGGSRAAFVIGDAEGIPKEVREIVKGNGNARWLSLGPLTFTHKMVSMRYESESSHSLHDLDLH